MLTRLRELFAQKRYRTDLKQFVEFGFGYGVVLVVGYLLLRKINLSLSAEEMGRFSYVQSLVMTLTPVFSLGANQAYLRFHDDHTISRNLRKLVAQLHWLSAMIVAVIVFGATRSWMALAYAAYPFFLEKTYFLRAQMETWKFNILRILELLVPLSLLYVLPNTNNANLVLMLYGGGFLVSFLFGSKKGNETLIDQRVVLRYLLPMVPTALMTVLTANICVLVTKRYLGYEAAGEMGVAVRALLFTKSLSTLFLMFFPMIYFREMTNCRFGVIKLYRAAMLFIMGGFIISTMVFAPFLYRLLGAGAYLSTIWVFIILSASQFFSFVIDTCCLYFGQEIKTWKNAIIQVLMLSLILIGTFFWKDVAAAAHDKLISFAIIVLVSTMIATTVGVVWAMFGERKYMKEFFKEEN